MNRVMLSRRSFLRSTALSATGALLAACAAEPQTVQKVVKETVVIEKVVEKQVTVLVDKEAGQAEAHRRRPQPRASSANHLCFRTVWPAASCRQSMSVCPRTLK